MANSNVCALCNYPITDPVCRDCYIRETIILLADLKINFMISDYIVYKLKKIFYSETLNDTECILCKQDNVSVCCYCFSVALIRVLRELNFTEDLIDNFGDNRMFEEISIENEDNSPMTPNMEHLRNYS